MCLCLPSSGSECCNVAGLGSSKSSPLYLMDYENACPPSPGHMHQHGGGGQRDHMATLEEQLLSYSENAENEGEDEYLEEKMIQVFSTHTLNPSVMLSFFALLFTTLT